MGQFRQLIERRDALGDDVLVRREHIVGQRFPVGEMQHRQLGGEEGEFFLEALGALAVGGEKKGEALCAAGGLGDGQAQRGSGKIAPGLLAAGGRHGRKAQYGHEWT